MHCLKNKALWPIHCLGFLTTSLYCILNFIEIQNAIELLLFFSIPILAWIFLHQQKFILSIEQNPIIIMAWAVLFRLVTWQVAPILEDDHFRYLWDGFVFYEFGTPYNTAPSDFFVSSLDLPAMKDGFQDILSRVSYPDIKTVYGPVFQWLFYTNYGFFGGEILGWQTLILMIDLSVLVLLYPLVTPRLLFQISWLPLSILNFSINVHADIISVLLILLCIHLYRFMNNSQRSLFLRRPFILDCLLGVLLALMVLSKIFALILLPFFLIARPRAVLAFISAIVLLYSPFIQTGSTDFLNILELPTGWSFNSLLQFWQDSILFSLFRYSCLICFLICFFCSFLS